MIHPESRLGKALAEGRTAMGIEHFAGNRAMVEMAADVGFDFNMIDLQLSYFDLETMESCITISKLTGITSLVRVPFLDPALITKIVNMGVAGIITPDCTDAKMAERAVAATKYQPEGTRMGCPMIKAAKFGLTPWSEYMEKEAPYIINGVLVESEEGVNNLDEIAAVPGLDMIWLGASDLSLSLGIPGADFTHPKLEYWLHKAGEICRRHKRALYIATGGDKGADYMKLITSEANMTSRWSDTTIFMRSCKRYLAGLEF